MLEPLRHIDNPRFGAVIFRRTTPEITNEGALWDESKRIYNDAGGDDHEGNHWWSFPSGATISFGHIELEKTVKNWQGSQIPLICCEVGTRVRMGDGSLKAGEEVSVGDHVATLRGPRRVSRTHEPMREPCVLATVVDENGQAMGSQVQARSHRILTLRGWQSFEDGRQESDSGSSRSNDRERAPQPSVRLPVVLWRPSHSRRRQRYAHPYSGRARTATADHQVGSCDLTPCGEKWVVHLAVEDEAHYITECGLVNQNCFDELTTFTEYQFWFMLSRNRSLCGVRPYVRATCNPDADSWVGGLIAWWIDQDTGYPITERSGMVRWFVRVGANLIWADDPKELEGYVDPVKQQPIPPKSLTFIPAQVSDNKILMAGDPSYVANLMALPTVERERLLRGNWKIRWDGTDFFPETCWLVNGRAVMAPAKCDSVYCVIDSAVKTGKKNDCTAVTYFARSKHTGYPLVILDYDLVQIEGDSLKAWLPGVLYTGERWATKCGARNGFLGALIEDKSSGTILLQAAAKMVDKDTRRPVKAQAIDSKLTAMGKEERALAISAYHYQGDCKISEHAFHKTVTVKGQTRNHLIGQVTSFRIGDPDAATRADDLLDTYCYGVTLGLDPARF